VALSHEVFKIPEQFLETFLLLLPALYITLSGALTYRGMNLGTPVPT